MQETLNGSQNGRYVVRRTPTILEDIEAQFPVCIDVGMEHPRQELDRRRFVGVRFVECEDESEGPVFEGSLGCIVGVLEDGREGRGRTNRDRR